MAQDRRNRRTALALLGVIAAMSVPVYYAVPLYQLFCQVTGFGGTTQQAAAAPGAVGERTVTVRLDANVHSGLAWDFRPLEPAVTLRVGEEALVFFTARNDGPEPLVGSATFNVSPAKAGQYFVKIDCFCFTEQRLEPGQQVDMPVAFFIDPAIVTDRNLDDVSTITLSYTFFRSDDAAASADLAEAD